jgi:4-nitrophenyl phosphatase
MPTVILDMDGVIYRGGEPLPGVVQAVETLRTRGAGIGFLTNNSWRTRASYIERLAEVGIRAEEREIMTSGEATARYLIASGHAGSRIYVVGGDGLAETLTRHGFEVDTNDEGEPCDFVVVGWDRRFTFAKIVRAQSEIVFNRASLIATNADPMFPAKNGRVLPGAGSMVAAIETASAAKAEVIGKPGTTSLRYLLEDLGAEPDSPAGDVWMVGDRLDTDIACGNEYGAHTVCVTTGITTRDQAEKATGRRRPEHIIDFLTELVDLVLH